MICGAALTLSRCLQEQPSEPLKVVGSVPREAKPGYSNSSKNSPSPPTKRIREPESAAARHIREKLETIVIPIVDMEDTSVEEAVDFLRVRANELDPTFREPHLGSIRFTKLTPGDPGEYRITFSARNISLWKALKQIASDAHLRMEVVDEEIEAVPVDPETDETSPTDR